MHRIAKLTPTTHQRTSALVHTMLLNPGSISLTLASLYEAFEPWTMGCTTNDLLNVHVDVGV
jgi:hypothetical protein